MLPNRPPYLYRAESKGAEVGDLVPPPEKGGPFGGNRGSPKGGLLVPSTLAERFRTAEPCGSVEFVGLWSFWGR